MEVQCQSSLLLILLLFPLANVIYGAISATNATILSEKFPTSRGREPIIRSMAIYGNVSSLYRRVPSQIRYQEASTSNIVTIEQDYIDLESPHLRIKFNSEGQALPLKKGLPPNVGLIAFTYHGITLQDMECVQAHSDILQSFCLMLTKSSEEMVYFRTVAKDLLQGALTVRPVSPGGFMVCVGLKIKAGNNMAKTYLTPTTHQKDHPSSSKTSFTPTTHQRDPPSSTGILKDRIETGGTDAFSPILKSTKTIASDIVLQENQNQKKRRNSYAQEFSDATSPSSASQSASKVKTPSFRLQLILRHKKPGIFFGATFSYGYLKSTTRYSDQAITVEDEVRRATCMSNWMYFYNPQIEITLNNETGFLTVTKEAPLSPNVRVFVANVRKNLTYRMESGIWPMLTYICIASSPDPRVTTSLQANAVKIIKSAFMLDNLPRGSILVCAQVVKSMLREVPNPNERTEPENSVPGVHIANVDHGKTTEPDRATTILPSSPTQIGPEFDLTDSIFGWQEDINSFNGEESQYLDDMHIHLLETFGESY